MGGSWPSLGHERALASESQLRGNDARLRQT